MHEVIGNYGEFINKLNRGLYSASIKFSELSMLDHLCYRVETNERYQELKTQLSSREEFVGETLVSNRPISIFEFITPIHAGGWDVPYLELPAPKTESHYEEGIEHAEFVVLGGLEKFQKRHSGLAFETKGMGRALNPELGLVVGNVAVKFHEQPLGSIVRIEQRLGMEHTV